MKLVSQDRVCRAKRSFVTRRVDLSRARTIIDAGVPQAGDIVLARIDRLGQHGRIELVSGRRARLLPGDEVVLAYGARYAADQFHAVVPDRIEPCHMVAAGGLAAKVVSRSAKVKQATAITPLGILADVHGRPLNLSDFAVPSVALEGRRAHTICVAGSGMNAGKTTLMSELIARLRHSGLRPGAIKLTGTGSGGDLWMYQDYGAQCALDFTDGGHASTVDVPVDTLQATFGDLTAAAGGDIDVLLVELADGLYQRETAALLRHPDFAACLDSVVFAAHDALGGVAGVEMLRSLDLTPGLVSGAVTASPLASSELAAASGATVVTIDDVRVREDILSICLQRARSAEGRRVA